MKCSINIYYIKSVHCYLRPPLVYGLYTCENVDNCERHLSDRSSLLVNLYVLFTKNISDKHGFNAETYNFIQAK